MIPQSTLQRIIGLAARDRLAAVYTNRDDEPVSDGGLMAYFVPGDWGYRRAAYYVDRILRGALPADLPVEQADTFALAMNRTTAADLGLAIPQSVALQVTEWMS